MAEGKSGQVIPRHNWDWKQFACGRRFFFQRLTGTRFQFVPYRGTAMPDLVAGQIDLMIDQASNALTQVRSGNIKAYAVATKNRMTVAPEIPTADEAGLAGTRALRQVFAAA